MVISYMYIRDMIQILSKNKIFLIAFTLGIVSWVICPIIGDRIEPFDTGRGYLVGQILMSAYLGYVGWSYGGKKILVAILGIYLGQLVYSLIVASDPLAYIGVITIWFLCVIPAISGSVAMLVAKIIPSKSK